MNYVLRLVAGLFPLFSATIAFADNDKKHAEVVKHPAVSAAIHAQPGDDMEVRVSAVVSQQTRKAMMPVKFKANSSLMPLKASIR